MSRLPAPLTDLLQTLKTDLPIQLGRNLVGVYLYGSLTQRAFNATRSDVDCIVVTNHVLSNSQFNRVRSWLKRSARLNVWTKRLQMTFLIRNEVLQVNSRSCHYQFGRLARTSSDANPIIWVNVLKSGRILYGEPPGAFVPVITRGVLFDALKREVGYLREELTARRASMWRDVPSYRVYAVLTLCRILYTRRKWVIASKPRAARWAMKHLPPEWTVLIAPALRGNSVARPAKLPLTRIREFVEYTGSQLDSARLQDESRPLQ